jgi:hypothetical protein
MQDKQAPPSIVEPVTAEPSEPAGELFKPIPSKSASGLWRTGEGALQPCAMQNTHQAKPEERFVLQEHSQGQCKVMWRKKNSLQEVIILMIRQFQDLALPSIYTLVPCVWAVCWYLEA